MNSLCHLLMKVNHVIVVNIYVQNRSLNAIGENKILAKISESTVRAIPEKVPGGGGGGGGGGKTAADIFFYGWLVRKDFKLYGSLVSDQIKLHGWLVFRCMEGEERILSAKKERSFIKSSQKKALSLANRRNCHFVYTQSSNLGCFRRILVKNGTDIDSPIVASVAVITSLGKHIFSEELFKETRL